MTRGTRIGAATALLLCFAGPARAQSGQPIESVPPPNKPSEYYRHEKVGNSIEEWARALDSLEPDRRLEVMDDLGRSADNRADTYLLKAIEDPDARIQAKAIDYLGSRRSSDATSVLVRKLYASNAPQAMRLHILSALGKIGDPKASRPIFDFVTRERSPDVRGTGIYALGEIGDLTIRDELEVFGKSEPDPRVKHIVQDAITKIARLPRPKERPFEQPSESIIPKIGRPEPES